MYLELSGQQRLRGGARGHAPPLPTNSYTYDMLTIPSVSPMQPTVHANQDCAGINGMQINGLCVCTLVPDTTLGTQWNIYVSYSRTPEICNVVHSSVTQVLYTFVQTPSLRMHERGLENGLSHIRYSYHSNIYMYQWRMVLNTVTIVTYIIPKCHGSSYINPQLWDS